MGNVFRMRKCLMLAALLATLPALAGEGNRYGYWWYEDPEPGAEDEWKLGPPPPEEKLKMMKPSEFEKMLEDYREYAVMSDDLESTAWYYELQDFARRRSRSFMNRTEVVMLQRAELNMNTEYPVSNTGQNAREQKRQQSIDSRLRKERNNVALVLLSKPSCPYCPAQKNALKYFQQRHGWAVKEINIEERPDIADKFGSRYTPTTVMIIRGSDEWMPVSVGVDNVPRIEENAYRALRMLRGETSASQFTLQEYQDGGAYDPQRSVR